MSASIKILVIDDEPAIRKLLRVCLESEGYQVGEAATAHDGLREAVSFRPELVILDGATSALDEGGEARLMATLVATLEGSTLISVGLRPGLEALHDRKLVLSRGERGAHLASVPLRPATVSRNP